MRGAVVTALLVALLLAVVSVPLPPTGAGSLRDGGGAATGGTSTSEMAGLRDTSPLAATPSLGNCSVERAHFFQLYPGLSVPPGIPSADFGGCPIGADDAAVSFLSAVNGSASEPTLTLQLPPLGSAYGSAYAMVGVRLAVSGVPCSVGGASVLSIELVPPLGPWSSASGTNWTVQTPAFDLAPAGTCDPSCTNDTALFTLDGAAFCEDQLLPAAGVALGGDGFAPGSQLSISLSGTVGGVGGLGLWINDTTDPAADVNRTFSSAVTSLGRPFEPLQSSAGLTRSLWDGAGAISVAYTDCPLPSGPSVACNSYNPSLDRSVGSVAVLNATFVGAGPGAPWYAEIATSSTTSACGGIAPTCAGFNVGAPSSYPTFSLASDAGAAALQFGNGPSSGPTVLGGPIAQFASGGSAGVVPLAVEPNPTSFSTPSTTLSSTVLDFSGIASVTYSAQYCRTSTTPVTNTALASLTIGDRTDGVWNGTVPGPTSSYSGDAPVAATLGLANGSLRFGGLEYLNVTTGSTCAFAAPPVPTNVTAVPSALGYSVRWNDSGTMLAGFQVRSTGSTSISVFVPQTAAGEQGLLQSTYVDLGNGGTTSPVNVTAVGLDQLSSVPTANVMGGSTLFALGVSTQTSASTVIGPNQLLNVTFTVGGGMSPYSVTVSTGNDTPPVQAVTASGTGTVSLPLGAYEGTLRISVNVTDAAQDAATAAPVWVSVLTNPLGTPQTSAAGDGFVSTSWGTPIVPGAALVTYFIYSTTNVSDAWRVGSAGVVPGTYNGITVAESKNHSSGFLVPDGGAAYVQVIAYCSTGLGMLPAGNLTLVGRPAPFLVSAITTVGGGVAPFTDSFSASVTGGSNDSLLSAVFSFPGYVNVGATISGGNGSYLVNGSYVFLSPGSFVVSLHVTDTEFDVGVVSTTVFVSPGVPPALSASLLNGPAYNGSTVQFQASTSGGSGTDAYNWSFGDGTSGNGPDPSHVYRLPGTYSVVVRAVDLATLGSNTTVLPITVFAAPVVFISVFPGANGTDSFDFLASVGGGSGISQVVWTFGDGTLGHGASVTHLYLSPGTYTVNATATDPTGHAGTTSYRLFVGPPSSSGAGGGNTGIDPAVFWAVVAAASAAVLAAIIVAFRRTPPPAAEPVGDYEEEDGAVTLQ